MRVLETTIKVTMEFVWSAVKGCDVQQNQVNSLQISTTRPRPIELGIFHLAVDIREYIRLGPKCL